MVRLLGSNGRPITGHADVEQHEGEVASAAGEDHEVPDLMVPEPARERVGPLAG